MVEINLLFLIVVKFSEYGILNTPKDHITGTSFRRKMHMSEKNLRVRIHV